MRILVSWNFTREIDNPGFCDLGMAYVLGLRALGHEVVAIDEVQADRCWDAEYRPVAFEDWDGRLRFESLMRSYDGWPGACLLYESGAATHGMPFDELVEFARGSDLLLTVGGRVTTPELLGGVACRAYVDQNPAKTQVWAFEYGVDYGFDRYDHLFSVGLNVGGPGCELPTGGREWIGAPQPVFLPDWPVAGDERVERWTTLTSWAGRSTFELNGRFSGEKSDQWLRLIDLPGRSGRQLELVARIEEGYAADRARLLEHGWSLRDPSEVSSLDAYRRYLAGSRGELSAAHSRYVLFRTGWISDRTVRYLACGRPAVVQSTGLEEHVSTGSGLLTFETPDQAAAAIEAVEGDYRMHCRAARALAEERFDATVVAARMLAAMGVAERAARPALVGGPA
jgi:hypothetical protein